ncbi:hypothetical protein THAOC_23045, partial [Thalassiosira oceanica]
VVDGAVARWECPGRITADAVETNPMAILFVDMSTTLI